MQLEPVTYAMARPLVSRIRMGIGEGKGDTNFPLDLTFTTDVVQIDGDTFLYRLSWDATEKGERIPYDVSFGLPKGLDFKFPQLLGTEKKFSRGVLVREGLIRRRAISFLSDQEPCFAVIPIDLSVDVSPVERSAFGRGNVSVYLPRK